MGVIIPNAENLRLTAYNLRNLGAVIVLASGCYDFLHHGHSVHLKKAKSLGDFLFVSINDDNMIRKLKGDKRPFVIQQHRAEMLSALRCVDFVYIFSEEYPTKVITDIKPDIYVKGDEYKDKVIPEKKTVEYNGGRVILLDTMLESSTKMMKILETNFPSGGE